MTLIKKLAVLILAFLLMPIVWAADPYPTKPVNLVVPYTAGGLSDIIAHSVNGSMAAQLGQPVLVLNFGGAGGAIGAQKVLGSPADGYNLFQGSPNETILVPLANAAVKYKSDDFRLVQMIGVAPMVIVARKDLPANDIDALIALARKSAGDKPLTFGSVGYGSLYHVLGEELSLLAGAKMMHVPYKGGVPLMQDLAAGQIDFTIAPLQQQILGLVESGRLKIIGTLAPAGKTESPLLKGYPSVNDGKLLKDFSFTLWNGLFVRKDTPEEEVQRLQSVLVKTLSEASVRSQLENQGLVISQPMSLSEAAKVYESETARYRAIAKSIKLEAQ